MSASGIETSIPDTLGALFLGYSIASILYGVTIVQIYLYLTSKRSAKDALSIKSFVYGLFVLDTGHTVLTMIGLYKLLVPNSASSPMAGEKVGIEMIDEAGAFGLVIILIVQLFFARRVWTVGRYLRTNVVARWILTLLTGTLFVSTLAMNIHITVQALQDRQAAVLSQTLNFQAWWIASFAGSTIGNLIYAGFMVALYIKLRRGSKTRLHPLIIFVVLGVDTGLITTGLTVAAMIQCIVAPGSLYYMALTILISKSYMNSAFVTLNGRGTLRSSLDEHNAEFGKGKEVMIFSAKEHTDESTTRGAIHSEPHADADIDIRPQKSEDFEFPVIKTLSQAQVNEDASTPHLDWELSSRTPSPIVFAERPIIKRLSRDRSIPVSNRIGSGMDWA